MKFLVVIVATQIGLLLAGCGGGSSDSATAGSTTTQAAESSTAPPRRNPNLALSKAKIAKLPQFDIKAPKGSAPRKLVVRDLRQGTGAVLRRPSSFLVDFAGVRYGETLKTTPSTKNAPMEFSFSDVIEGWKRGLPGMRVGGRRELLVPRGMGDAGGPAIYVIDLLAVYPNR